MTIDARLLGGPFCGDAGRLDEPRPDRLWVYACGGRLCRFNGVHWARGCQDAPQEAIIYDRGPVEDGVQLYVFEDLRLESGDKARDATRAPRELMPA